jgi:hypothetical protein
MHRPTPHGSKLKELVSNTKLPPGDITAVETAVQTYEHWIESMSSLTSTGQQKIKDLVDLLNSYKRHIEVDLIWDSKNDFIYRQKGQIKLDNSIIEEFLPWLIDDAIIAGIESANIITGPQSAFASSYFTGSLTTGDAKPGLRIRAKDQDFTISKPVFIAASFDKAFSPATTDVQSVALAYIAAECKTNLDKTMFQEATATAHDLKIAAPASRYFLLCEFLDMKPISTAGSDIAEVLILRGKRINSNLRKDFSNADNRVKQRAEYVEFLDKNPVRFDVIQRFVNHITAVFNEVDPDESDVVAKGYF